MAYFDMRLYYVFLDSLRRIVVIIKVLLGHRKNLALMTSDQIMGHLECSECCDAGV